MYIKIVRFLHRQNKNKADGLIPVPSSVLLVTILLIWRKISKISNMDRNRTVAGLDIHKDSIYLCIMRHDEAIIFEKTYGVLPPSAITSNA